MFNLFKVIRLLFVPRSKKDIYKKIVDLLGFFPGNLLIYEKAFVHKSASIIVSKKHFFNNERLEFLGDAVIDTIIADYLFNHYKKKDEGFLTQMRAKIVKRKQLNYIAKKLKIDKLVVTQTNITENKHIYGNALEAFIGAIFIDKGYKQAKKYFIKNIIEAYLNLENLQKTESDFKSRLIEWAQKSKSEVIFNNTEEISDQKNTPVFYSSVMVEGHEYGSGKGFSKKEAEQNAAKITLEMLPDTPQNIS